MNHVNGLCTTIDLLLHPSILSADSIQEMFRNLLHIYSETNGKDDPDHMDDVFNILMKQHVEEIRDLGFENNAPLHALGHWQGR